MKSILIWLLLLSLTLWSKCYSQTSGDSVYCLPIGKARLLVSAALKARLTDSLLVTADNRIDLLESEKLSSYAAYINLLKLSEQKFETQKEITADFVRLADSWRDESDYYQKRYRQQRRQKGLLTAGMVGLLILVIAK